MFENYELQTKQSSLKYFFILKEEGTSKSSGGGDLMSDLANKLSRRRAGVAGSG